MVWAGGVAPVITDHPCLRNPLPSFGAATYQAHVLRSYSRSFHLPAAVEAEPAGCCDPAKIADRFLDEFMASQTGEVQVRQAREYRTMHVLNLHK